LILTVAMVGAIIIARRQVLTPQDRVQERAFTPGQDNPHSIPVYGTSNPRHNEHPQE
jgi:hypothetical protein